MSCARIALVFIFFAKICSSHGYPLSVKVIPPKMVDEAIASAERPYGGSYAYNRPYSYSSYGQFGMPYGSFGIPYGYGFGQTMGQGAITSEEESGEPISEGEERDNAKESAEEEPIIEKRSLEYLTEPIIVEIPVEEFLNEEEGHIMSEVDDSVINDEPVYGVEESMIAEKPDPDGESVLIEGPSEGEVESNVNYLDS